MQLKAKHTESGFGTQSVFRKNRRAGKTELIEALELLLQVLLRLAKLAAVTLVKDEHHLPLVDRQITLALHQVVELLDSSDNDLVVILVQIALEPGGTVRAIHTVR